MLKRILFSGSVNSRATDLAMLILRVFTGTFIAFGHGMGKFSPEMREMMVGGLTKMNIPMPTAAYWAATLAEFAGGILLALGLLTRPAAFFIAFTMTVAVTTAHWNDPLFMTGKGGAKEPALLYLVPALFFLIAGAGRYGLDALFRGRNDAFADRTDSTAR